METEVTFVLLVTGNVHDNDGGRDAAAAPLCKIKGKKLSLPVYKSEFTFCLKKTANEITQPTALVVYSKFVCTLARAVLGLVPVRPTFSSCDRRCSEMM